MSGLALSLLGPFTATIDGQSLGEFRTRSAQALLVYLACQPEPQSRETLTALLWPETPQLSAHQNLRQTLYLLRQWLPDVPAPAGDRRPLILAGRKSIQLNPESPIVLDVAVFNALIDQPQPSPQQLAEAIALYRGDFLANFYLPESNPFEDWVTARRAYLQRRVLTALDKLTVYAKQNSLIELQVTSEKAQASINNVEGMINALGRIRTESQHSVNTNADSARSEISSLTGMNTSSTHTIYVTKVETNATGGLVGAGVPRFAVGGAVAPMLPSAFTRMTGGSVPGSGCLVTRPRNCWVNPP